MITKGVTEPTILMTVAKQQARDFDATMSSQVSIINFKIFCDPSNRMNSEGTARTKFTFSRDCHFVLQIHQEMNNLSCVSP